MSTPENTASPAAVVVGTKKGYWTPKQSTESKKTAPKESDWNLPGSQSSEPASRTRNAGRRDKVSKAVRACATRLYAHIESTDDESEDSSAGEELSLESLSEDELFYDEDGKPRAA